MVDTSCAKTCFHARIFPNVWERYFFKEWLKVFLLFLGCFYFLYVLIDLSAHTKVFHQNTIRYVDILLYYLCQFTRRADILIPFALLIGVIKVLTTLNQRNELVVLVTSGIPLKRLLRPFFAASILCMTLLYFNFQWVTPKSLQQLQSFEDHFFRDKTKKEDSSLVHHLFLEDHSLLIYRTYDPIQNAFIDAFWIHSLDDLYRIKALYPYEKIAKGTYVDHLIRASSGTLIHKNSFETFTFPQMTFEGKSLYAASHPPRWQTFTQLASHIPWRQIYFGFGKMSDREAQAVSCFYYKLLFPLVCLLCVICPAPFAMRFSRFLPIFFIYCFSLFGMIAFFTLVNSSVILGESQVMPPAWAISFPFLGFFMMFGWKYAKI